MKTSKQPVYYHRSLRSTRYMRTLSSKLVIVAILTLLGGAVLSPLLVGKPSYAAGEQATVGMPFTGKWAWDGDPFSGPYTDNNSSHPSVHAVYYGQWGTDLYGAADTAVKLNVTSPNGAVTFTKQLNSDTCSSKGPNIAGKGIVLNVLVNGNKVGEVDYEHLDNISTGPYVNGMTIGTITSEALHATCYSVRHAHIELKNVANFSCYVDKGQAGVRVDEGDPIGVLGSTNTGAKQACSSVPSTPSPPPPPVVNQEGTSVSGDFNGDGHTDMTIFHKRPDGGADVKVVYGGTGAGSLTSHDHRVGLVGPGWEWSKMKIVAGKFNGDNYTDIAIFHKRTDLGADIKLLYGNALPNTFTNVVHLNELPGSAGWRWDDMKIVAGHFNDDPWDDVGIVHKRSDGGAAVKLVYGNIDGHTFNTYAHTLDMPAWDSWDWNKMLVTAGKYNGDVYSDISILHKRTDGGADIKIVYGNFAPYALTGVAHLNSLPGTIGWTYDNMKLASGRFNDDAWDDVSILHKHAVDNGVDVKIVFGNINGYTLNAYGHQSTLPAANGWNWNDMKFTSGDYNSDTFDDIGILHKHSYDAGADIKTIYGDAYPNYLVNNAHRTTLPANDNWDWSKMKAF